MYAHTYVCVMCMGMVRSTFKCSYHLPCFEGFNPFWTSGKVLVKLFAIYTITINMIKDICSSVIVEYCVCCTDVYLQVKLYKFPLILLYSQIKSADFIFSTTLVVYINYVDTNSNHIYLALVCQHAQMVKCM